MPPAPLSGADGARAAAAAEPRRRPHARRRAAEPAPAQGRCAPAPPRLAPTQQCTHNTCACMQDRVRLLYTHPEFLLHTQSLSLPQACGCSSHQGLIRPPTTAASSNAASIKRCLYGRAGGKGGHQHADALARTRTHMHTQIHTPTYTLTPALCPGARLGVHARAHRQNDRQPHQRL